MKIKYYFEYEVNKKHQMPENGTVEINDWEFRIIKTACECRKMNIKTFLEKFISELTIEDAERKLMQWDKEKTKT